MTSIAARKFGRLRCSPASSPTSARSGRWRAASFRIACAYDAASIAIGASIACDGCCLTVTRVESDGAGRSIFDVEASNETFAHTTLGDWSHGRRINLERSLRLGDELGGHMVAGHVDGVARDPQRHARRHVGALRDRLPASRAP